MDEVSKAKLQEIINLLKNIDKTMNEQLNFFRAIEESSLGDDKGYNEELKKDSFRPKIV